MKTLFIISSGMKKPPDAEIQRMEQQDETPRTKLLENELNTQLLDERYLQNISGFRKYMYKLLPINVAQFIEACLIHHQYDAVVSYYEKIGLPFAYYQKLTASKTPHILLTTWFSNKKKAWFMEKTHHSLAKIITWSSNQYRFALNELNIPPEHIKLVKRGVDSRFWRPMESPTSTICSAGMEMRDYPTLVRALENLEIPCHIATGEARGHLFRTVKNLYKLNQIPPHITIGQLKPAEMRNLYMRSRFVVVPLLETDTDNGLTVILEAMAMGKAVICSKVEGQIDIIKNGVTGIYVPQGDHIAMRKAIKELWDNPEKAAEMGRAARQYIEEHHGLEEFVQAIKTEVEHAAGSRKRGWAGEPVPAELISESIPHQQ